MLHRLRWRLLLRCGSGRRCFLLEHFRPSAGRQEQGSNHGTGFVPEKIYSAVPRWTRGGRNEILQLWGHSLVSAWLFLFWELGFVDLVAANDFYLVGPGR